MKNLELVQVEYDDAIWKSRFEEKRRELIAICKEFRVLNRKLSNIQRIYHERFVGIYRKIQEMNVEIDLYRRNFLENNENREFVFDEEFHRFEEEVKHRKARKKRRITSAQKVNINVLYKRLAKRFHPDLASDATQKSKREVLMKRINEAYASSDYDALEEIDANLLSPEMIICSTPHPKQRRLLFFEQAITLKTHAIKQLHHSPFYKWKSKIEKGNKKGIDYLALTEKVLTDKMLRLKQRLEKIKNMNITPIASEVSEEHEVNS